MLKTLAYLGIDIAKLKFVVCLFAGEQVHTHNFPNTLAGHQALLAWCRQLGAPLLHACLEATGRYGDKLAAFLHEHGQRVSVVNPARIKFFALACLARNKTDELDAELIARFCQQQQPRLWQPPSPAHSTLQALTRLLDDLNHQRQAQRNRIQTAVHPQVKRILQQLEKSLTRQIDKLKTELQTHLQTDPQLKKNSQLLASIPGIGTASALVVLAELPPGLTGARQAAAYAGVTPRRRQSGSSVRGKTVMSKTGNARLRRQLYWPAIVACRCNPVVRALAQRLAAKGKSKMCIIGAAMRKLLHLTFGVLKHQHPFVADWKPLPVAI